MGEGGRGQSAIESEFPHYTHELPCGFVEAIQHRINQMLSFVSRKKKILSLAEGRRSHLDVPGASQEEAGKKKSKLIDNVECNYLLTERIFPSDTVEMIRLEVLCLITCDPKRRRRS